MKKIVILLFMITALFAEIKKLNLFTFENVNYNYVAKTTGFNDTKISYNLPGFNYVYMDKNFVVLASLKYSERQHIGATMLGGMNITIEQRGWKYELGAGYKFYLTEKLYLGPAVLFSDSYSSLYQIVNNSTTEIEKHDNDLRAYLILGYNITNSAMLFSSLEVDNDLLSDDYYKDYSQYNVSATLYQFLSPRVFLYLKYEQSLRDKDARTTISGNGDYKGYGLGLGYRF